VRGRTLGDAMHEAGCVVQAIKSAGGESRFRVLGPAPAPFVKLRGEHRAQFFVKGTSRAAIRDAIRRALDARPDARRRIAIDVDPMTVL
jgi:primosomal protein N' (replication factor Y)